MYIYIIYIYLRYMYSAPADKVVDDFQVTQRCGIYMCIDIIVYI